ncbi:protein BIG GRAIN 1-like E [Euphorbia lathyris]|uniref:protein BIG GRAIN 1-like E n=1 Tax=Euphorbia lathyris TaxID=212925 RepID=UPI003313F6A7
MSITGLSENTGKLYKKSIHHRNDSDELDVFEAARYYHEAAGYNSGATCTQNVLREEHKYPWRGGRMSLDIPMRNPIPQQSHIVEKQILKEKKCKQPSSPGGRLASFLNSLFNQTSSKKKKSKSATQSMRDEDESPGGRRKRRSSISHFRSSSSTTDTKSLYSSSSSGFRTPPPNANTPTKNYRDFKSYSDNKQVISVPKHSTTCQKELLDDNRNKNLSWLDEKNKFSEGFPEKPKNHGNRCIENDRTWVNQYQSEEKEFKKFKEVDDGAESDSSSDLFELQNCDLGIYSSGLPVYETTHMDSIKRGTPISNGTI